ALASPIELKPGDHVLVVKRGKETIKRVLLTVAGGRNPGLKLKDITPPSSDPATDDLARLQGEWVVSADEHWGAPLKEEEMRQMDKVITFVDNHMTIRRNYKDGRRVKMEGTVHLDTKSQPKTWDFTGTHYEGKPIVLRGLYELNGDSLRIV